MVLPGSGGSPLAGSSSVTISAFRRYAEPFSLWDTCPPVRWLASGGENATDYHLNNMRNVLAHRELADPIVKLRITEIERADILDLRERLVEKLSYTCTLQRAVSMLKFVLKEAFSCEKNRPRPNHRS